MPRKASTYISSDGEVVEGDIPLLIGLSLLKLEGLLLNSLKLYSNNIYMTIYSKIRRKSRRTFLARSLENKCFTRDELGLLYLHVLHSKTDKIYNLSHGGVSKSKIKTFKRLLNNISSSYGYYRELNQPHYVLRQLFGRTKFHLSANWPLIFCG